MEQDKKRFIYQTIYEDIYEKINSGYWKPGSKIPNELELMEQFQVSRASVRKALHKLENNGYISRKTGIGSFVKFNKMDYMLARMEGYSEQMKRIHINPSSELLSIELMVELQPEIIEALNLNKRDKVYCIARIRKADGDPMAYEIVYVPQKLCPDLHTHVTETASLFDIYERVYGHKMKFGDIELEAELANTQTQKVLGVRKSEPMLKMKCTVTMENDQPLYYVICYYIGDKYKFTTRLPR